MFSMSVCTLWTSSRAIIRISGTLCRSAISGKRVGKFAQNHNFSTMLHSHAHATLPLKNLMMSVKSMLFSSMMSRYISTRARAMKSTKCSEEVYLAAQIVSQTENTSSYTISERSNTIKPRSNYRKQHHSMATTVAMVSLTSFKVQ